MKIKCLKKTKFGAGPLAYGYYFSQLHTKYKYKIQRFHMEFNKSIRRKYKLVNLFMQRSLFIFVSNVKKYKKREKKFVMIKKGLGLEGSETVK